MYGPSSPRPILLTCCRGLSDRKDSAMCVERNSHGRGVSPFCKPFSRAKAQILLWRPAQILMHSLPHIPRMSAPWTRLHRLAPIFYLALPRHSAGSFPARSYMLYSWIAAAVYVLTDADWVAAGLTRKRCLPEPPPPPQHLAPRDHLQSRNPRGWRRGRS